MFNGSKHADSRKNMSNSSSFSRKSAFVQNVCRDSYILKFSSIDGTYVG